MTDDDFLNLIGASNLSNLTKEQIFERTRITAEEIMLLYPESVERRLMIEELDDQYYELCCDI